MKSVRVEKVENLFVAGMSLDGNQNETLKKGEIIISQNYGRDLGRKT